MPTSVPNFNFLAPLVTEICMGPKIKTGELLTSQTSPSWPIFTSRHRYLQMPTSVPNFNFLARLVSEIWGVSKIKSGSSWFPRLPLADNILYSALVRVVPTSMPNFNFLAPLVT